MWWSIVILLQLWVLAAHLVRWFDTIIIIWVDWRLDRLTWSIFGPSVTMLSWTKNRELAISFIEAHLVEDTVGHTVRFITTELGKFNTPFLREVLWLPHHQWYYVSSLLNSHTGFKLTVDGVEYLAVRVGGLYYVASCPSSGEVLYFRRLCYNPCTVSTKHK